MIIAAHTLKILTFRIRDAIIKTLNLRCNHAQRCEKRETAHKQAKSRVYALGGNMSTRFIIIRHGQSLGNAKRILLGHTDWDLSDLGREQAVFTARALSGRKIDAVYSSDLLRAYNTVLPEAAERGLEVITEPGLRDNQKCQ